MTQPHWDRLWADRTPDEVSWFQAEPTESLALIRSVSEPSASIVDIGGGASTLVDALLGAGYSDLTVFDLASGALARCRERLGERARDVDWVVGDVTSYEFGRTGRSRSTRAASSSEPGSSPLDPTCSLTTAVSPFAVWVPLVREVRLPYR